MEVLGDLTLITRRQAVCRATGAAALISRADVFGAEAKYDLIIKGGRVIDPSRKLDAMQRRGDRDGRIAAVESQHFGRARPKRSMRAASWWCPD